jgi:hypothetical protein
MSNHPPENILEVLEPFVLELYEAKLELYLHHTKRKPGENAVHRRVYNAEMKLSYAMQQIIKTEPER